jgi:hypothetical protein
MNVFWPDCIIFWTINIKNIAMRAIKDFISYQRNYVLTLMFTYNLFKKKMVICNLTIHVNTTR